MLLMFLVDHCFESTLVVEPPRTGSATFLTAITVTVKEDENFVKKREEKILWMGYSCFKCAVWVDGLIRALV